VLGAKAVESLSEFIAQIPSMAIVMNYNYRHCGILCGATDANSQCCQCGVIRAFASSGEADANLRTLEDFVPREPPLRG
jgi:hypothetical protein